MALNNTYATIYLNDGSASWVITDYVLSVSTSIGKNRMLDSFQPGTGSVTVKNFNREFDPTNTSSPLYGVVIPRGSYIIIGSGSNRIFFGFVDNWTFNYDVSGESTATISLIEGTGLFARQYLFSSSFPAELSGSRVQRVLDDLGVNFENVFGPFGLPTIIYDGTRTLAADTNCKGQNALEYLQNIVFAEQGAIYYNDDGTFVFEDNTRSMNSNYITNNRFFTDDETAGAYPYVGIEVDYSSDLLYNNIALTPADGNPPVEASDPQSKLTYNISELDYSNVLYSDNAQLSNLALYLLAKYSTPELRINTVSVSFFSLSDSVKNNLLANVGINSFCRVKFTPNKVGTAIEKFVRVIGISHSISLNEHIVTFSFESLRNPALVLDDVEFGKLDYYSLGL